MDYSVSNIQFQHNHGIANKRLFHVPIAQLISDGFCIPSSYDYDVAFYGDTHSERRQKYLIALRRKFKVLVIDNSFGKDAFDQLHQAKLVVNIHYYEGALLETTRLFECISNGLLVVSELASDMPEHQQLMDIVDFVAVGDVDAMMARVQFWLDHESERLKHLEKLHAFASQELTPFTQQFDQVLTAIGIKSAGNNSQ